MMIWSTFNTCFLDNVLPIYEVNDYNYNNNNIYIYNNSKRNSAEDIS